MSENIFMSAKKYTLKLKNNQQKNFFNSGDRKRIQNQGIDGWKYILKRGRRKNERKNDNVSYLEIGACWEQERGWLKNSLFKTC